MLLENVPDESVVLVPNFDHGYNVAGVQQTTVLHGGRATYTEDHGEALTPEAEYGKRVNAVVVGY